MWRILWTKVQKVKQRELMFCIKLPNKDIVIYWFRQAISPISLPYSVWDGPKVEKHNIWILREVPTTRDISWGTECSVVINWRERKHWSVLENANSHPMQNLIWFKVYHLCLEREDKETWVPAFTVKTSYTLAFITIFFGLLQCARHCESNELESQI